MHWRRQWQPTPLFLPGESQGQRSLVGCHFGHDWSDLAAGVAVEFSSSFLVKLSKPEYLYTISEISQNLFPVSHWPQRELFFYMLKTSFAWRAVPLISVARNYAGLLTRNFSWDISNIKLRNTLGSFSMKFHIQYDPASSHLRNNSNGIVLERRCSCKIV